MRCPDCGSESPENSKFCARCGYAFDPYAHRPMPWTLPHAREKKESRIVLIVLVIVILVVVMPVVLSAVLYFMVLGFDNRGEVPPLPVTMLTRTRTANGMDFQFSAASEYVEWSEVSFVLAGSRYATSWTPETDQWTFPPGHAVCHSGPVMFGQLVVWFNLTDLTANGAMNQGDHFTIETGAPYAWPLATQHEMTVNYIPADYPMVSTSFYF